MLKRAEKNLNSLNEAKKGRTTQATVRAKEYVRFDEQNHQYLNNFGETVEATPGTEQWRIYYQIDNFDQVPEPERRDLMRSEEAGIKKFGFRFYPLSTAEKAFYDKTQVGDRLEICIATWVTRKRSSRSKISAIRIGEIGATCNLPAW